MIAMALEGLAAVAAARDQSERSQRLLGGADRLREQLRMPRHAVQRELLDQRLNYTRVALGEAQSAAAWAEGYAASLDGLVADALHIDTEAARESDRAPAMKWLTRREREVAALVAEGLHNTEIAERLRISPNTVEVHMSNILRKLSMTSRTQLAAWAVEQNLLRDR
jgi:non-specific serine/threonine protein kinase